MISIIRKRRLCELTGRSYSANYRDERNGKFPKRVRLGKRAVGWIEAEVLAWIESRPRVSSDVSGTANAPYETRNHPNSVMQASRDKRTLANKDTVSQQVAPTTTQSRD